MQNDLTTPASLNPSVVIPGKRGHGPMVFNKDGFTYRDKTYNYNTVTGMFFHSESLSINLIPAHTTFNAGLRFGREKLDFVFSAPFNIGRKKLQESYAAIIGLFIQFIEPWLINSMVKDIFEGGKSVTIGKITFSKEGYSAKKLFGGLKTVLWSEKVYIPQMDRGWVYVYKDKDGKGASFDMVSMRTMNAVLLPELVNACYNRFHKGDEK